MSWKLYYSNPDGSNERNVNLESLGTLDGGQVTGDGIRFTFNSHKASEVSVRIPAIDPANNPVLPFMSRVRIVDGAGSQRFVGRRIDWDGVASPDSSGTTYQFQDAWWDLSKITFKQAWWAGSYMPITYNSSTGVVTLPNLNTSFSNFKFTANFYTKSGSVYTRIGQGFTLVPVYPLTFPATVTLSGGSGAPTASCYMSLQYTFTDVVLFQNFPGNPYQTAADVEWTGVNKGYITTGDQIIETLNFAIDQGVQLQIGEIDPLLYVPWYPVRCQNCAEIIKICLRDHPDCFTEIDYTTTPPTFNVRRRTNLTRVTLPYSYTDVNGNQHNSTNIKPRPDLIVARIGIFYRYMMNGSVVSYPTDIWPVDAPDGILALDYSIDLQGPNTDQSFGQIVSVPLPSPLTAFNPASATDWWLSKHAQFRNNTAEFPTTGDIDGLAMCDATGNASVPTVFVTDGDGNAIDTSVYQWEMIGGGQALWMSGINCVPATVKTWFKYSKKKYNSDGTVSTATKDSTVAAQLVSVNVNLVNTASIQQTYIAMLTSGEAIPANLAFNIWTSLQTMQYNLHQSFKVEPLVNFIKPGLNCVCLAGGNADWTTMDATVQESSYTLHQRPDSVIWAKASISCGPVEHLEAGQLVQLFNIFANRDLAKIDPWERITGQNGGNGSDAIANTPKENSVAGLPGKTQGSVSGPNVP